MKLELSQHIFQKYASIEFYENSSSGSRVVPCGKTDRLYEAKSLFAIFRTRVKRRKVARRIDFFVIHSNFRIRCSKKIAGFNFAFGAPLILAPCAYPVLDLPQAGCSVGNRPTWIVSKTEEKCRNFFFFFCGSLSTKGKHLSHMLSFSHPSPALLVSN